MALQAVWEALSVKRYPHPPMCLALAPPGHAVINESSPAAPGGGSSPGASLLWLRPRVVVTWGITAVALAPGDLFTVMPRVGPTPPRARATVLSTSAELT